MSPDQPAVAPPDTGTPAAPAAPPPVPAPNPPAAPAPDPPATTGPAIWIEQYRVSLHWYRKHRSNFGSDAMTPATSAPDASAVGDVVDHPSAKARGRRRPLGQETMIVLAAVAWAHEDGKTYSLRVQETGTTIPIDQSDTGRAWIVGVQRGVPYHYVVSDATTKTDIATSTAYALPEVPVSKSWSITSWVVVALWLAAAAAMVITWRVVGDKPDTYYSMAIAFGFMGGVSLLWTVNNRDLGLWSPIVGHDVRISTSKAQVYSWTTLIAFVLVYFSSRVLIGGESNLFDFAKNATGDSGTSKMWADYLILLGGPFVALASSKLIVNTQVSNGNVSKPDGESTDLSLSQVFSGDSGNADLVDSQYLIFNLVAFVYVLLALCATNKLPQIPTFLFALTSASAATYVVNKTAAASAPTISALVPSKQKIGESLVVVGLNFKPSGTPVPPAVTIGGVAAAIDPTFTDTQLSITPANGTKIGAGQPVVVTNAAGVSSTQGFVEIEA